MNRARKALAASAVAHLAVALLMRRAPAPSPTRVDPAPPAARAVEIDFTAPAPPPPPTEIIAPAPAPAPPPPPWMAGADARHTGRTALRGPRREPVIRWRVRTGRRVTAAPAARGGLAVFASLDGTVHAVDRAGVERWAHLGTQRVFGAPAVTVGLTVFGHDGGAWVGLDDRGRERWRIESAEDADAAPVLGSDGTVYVASREALAIAPSGEVRWRRALEGHVFGAPAVVGEHVLFPERTGVVAMLRARDGAVERRVPLGAMTHGGVLGLDDGFVVVADDGHVRCFGLDGERRWDFATEGAARGRGARSTPALRRDGTVVVGAEDGAVYGLAVADGAQRWRVQTAGPVRTGAAIDADDWAYVGSEDDRVWAIDPSGRAAWSVTVGADVDATPAVLAEGLLVAGADDGALYALGE
ncbi:MAG: PQQ-binding-like beta-propeller repeat protein [Polyangiales bacterium]